MSGQPGIDTVFYCYWYFQYRVRNFETRFTGINIGNHAIVSTIWD